MRRTAMLPAAIALALVLAGCGSSSAEETTTTVPPTTTTTAAATTTTTTTTTTPTTTSTTEPPSTTTEPSPEQRCAGATDELVRTVEGWLSVLQTFYEMHTDVTEPQATVMSDFRSGAAALIGGCGPAFSGGALSELAVDLTEATERHPMVTGFIESLLVEICTAAEDNDFELTPEGQTACAGPTHTLSGTVYLSEGDFVSSQDGNGCTGTGKFGGVNENSRVIVHDGEGRPLAATKLQPGEKTALSDDLLVCSFSFEVLGVPDADSYTVEVTGAGETTITYEQLEGWDWKVQMLLQG